LTGSPRFFDGKRIVTCFNVERRKWLFAFAAAPLPPISYINLNQKWMPEAIEARVECQGAKSRSVCSSFRLFRNLARKLDNSARLVCYSVAKVQPESFTPRGPIISDRQSMVVIIIRNGTRNEKRNNKF
jgi:hypothetical protein